LLHPPRHPVVRQALDFLVACDLHAGHGVDLGCGGFLTSVAYPRCGGFGVWRTIHHHTFARLGHRRINRLRHAN
jgi:hypothetical protein